MAAIQDVFVDNRSNGGGVGLTLTGVSTPSQPVSNPPQELFDISVLSGLKPSDKYLGRNTASDIQEVYQSYLTNNPIGRGGKYITDAARKYSVSFTEAARGYLLGAGLNIIPGATTNQTTDTNTNTNTNIVQKNPLEILTDAFSKAFGNAVYNPPLQQQSYGYTPQDISTPIAQSGSSGGIGLYVILAIVGIVGYFLYKRFVS